ncbi:SsrA-binding protein, partial [Salmonella enterica subsp. enterica serovar Enteritidis]|nr:SsrA-binding protein [Salmonella enterica subsp. enterica serovar Enteritidis]
MFFDSRLPILSGIMTKKKAHKPGSATIA